MSALNLSWWIVASCVWNGYNALFILNNHRDILLQYCCSQIMVSLAFHSHYYALHITIEKQLLLMKSVVGIEWSFDWNDGHYIFLLVALKRIKLLIYHSPQGYSFEKRNMNSFRDSRSCSVGFSGYLAIIVCKNYCSEWKSPCLIYPSLPSMLLSQALLYWKERCFNNKTLPSVNVYNLSVWFVMCPIITCESCWELEDVAMVDLICLLYKRSMVAVTSITKVTTVTVPILFIFFFKSKKTYKI